MTRLMCFVGIVLACTVAVEVPHVDAHDVKVVEDTLVVQGRRSNLTGTATSASQVNVGRNDLKLRPIAREGELFEANPGMIATQHSGDGKSNQLFLRGFNLDHGTDFRTILEGMPVNMRTHGHGQGYTDITFLIPEFVAGMNFRKGVYDADIGDFGSAGSARIKLLKNLPGPFVRVDAGAWRMRRVVAGTSAELGAGDLLLGGEVKGYDGPWDKPQDLQKFSGFGRYSWMTGSDQWSLLAMGYDNTWESSDQIPKRAVEAGTITRFGQIDPTLGGRSSRYSLSADWRRLRTSSVTTANLHAIYYDLDLYSNFTYLAADSVNGDQFRQVDDRIIVGGELTQRQTLFEDHHTVLYGLQSRADFISDVGLSQTQARQEVATIRKDEVTQVSGGAFVTVTSRWNPSFRSNIGLRGDLYSFDVDAISDPRNSGSKTAGLVSPKLGLIFSPYNNTEFYLNGGLGFHSNDARGTVIKFDPATGDPAETVDPLVQSRGGEIGVRVAPVSGLRSTVSVWALELDSELLFVGDAGTTEASDKSRRVGIELANFYRVTPSVSVDLDLAFVDAKFVDVGPDDRIPGAIENVIAAGVMWDFPKSVFGALRVRHLGRYPLIEDGSVKSELVTLVNTSLGTRWAGIAFNLAVLNIFDEEQSDIQYFYGSRLPGETAIETEDIHFHPVEPRQARFTVTYGF